jgi:hypothetical protein
MKFLNTKIIVGAGVGSTSVGKFPQYNKLQVEEELEASLCSMFERVDPMKAWELKKMSSAAWQQAFRLLHF